MRDTAPRKELHEEVPEHCVPVSDDGGGYRDTGRRRPRPGTCRRVHELVWNANGGQFSNKAVPCAVGHYNGYATGPFWSSTSVHSYAHLVVNGKVVPLQACPFFTICNAPVRFFGDEPRGDFMLVAQPGHFDSPGSTVRFHFSTDASGYLHLSVRAWVLGSQLADPVNQSGAWEAWASFASNLTVNLYQRCGGIRCS
jgi:hypothetical protein